MSGELDFESGVPIWSVLIEHNTPNTPGIWSRVFNYDPQPEDESALMEKIVELFHADGLHPARIVSIWTEELKPLGGEENGNE